MEKQTQGQEITYTLEKLSPEGMVDFLMNEVHYPVADINYRCKLMQCATYIQTVNELIQGIRKEQE